MSDTKHQISILASIMTICYEIFRGFLPIVLAVAGCTFFVSLTILTEFSPFIVIGVAWLVLLLLILYSHPKFRLENNTSMKFLILGAMIIFLGAMALAVIKEIPGYVKSWSSEKDAARLKTLSDCQIAPSCSLSSDELQELNKILADM